MNFNNRKYKVSNTRRNNLMHQHKLRSEWLVTSSADKDLPVLMENKRNMRQQHTPAAQASLGNVFSRITDYWAGRDPQGSSSPTPGPAQLHPQESHHVPENIVQKLLEVSQLSAVKTSLEPVPVPKHPLGEEPLPDIQPKPPLA
ncbi:hypothetical protein TURU_144541 [Turdus rufiventris]|nr:hypothetical protein TURU_144541 [Turdus rufiventris]